MYEASDGEITLPSGRVRRPKTPREKILEVLASTAAFIVAGGLWAVITYPLWGALRHWMR